MLELMYSLCTVVPEVSPLFHGCYLRPLSLSFSLSLSLYLSFSPPSLQFQSILDQYGYSSDQQRKEFLDSLFTFLEKEGKFHFSPQMIL